MLRELSVTHAPGAGSGAHEGRVRTFQHVDGSFPAHVYIALPVLDRTRLQLERLTASVSTFTSGGVLFSQLPAGLSCVHLLVTTASGHLRLCVGADAGGGR